MNQTVDITPSPRVLRMLGQIDFKPWQCLAELIDNSIDSFIDQMENGTPISSPRININLPSDAELQNGTGKLIIKDNGAGMTLAQLQNAVRAGYSGNDPVEKMGLFGMGFNISTARLGRRTEVWTTTGEASEWIGVVIDFDQLEKAQTFKAEVMFRPKNEFELETKQHGTEVIVTKLEPERMKPLIWGAGKAKTHKKLGKIYGRVMNKLGITILFAGDKIKPWQHCTWGAHRSVPNKVFGNVPARIDIDETLPSRGFCTTCWIWLSENEKTCPSCGLGNAIISRERHLRGWLGIQRYFDKEHYGFDLIRNGRVIEDLDKSLFYFENSQGERDLEYPIDAIHWGGRIVGELEIDFVRVSHQKDSFDKLDPEWRHVVELIRGNSPLRPQIAKNMGLPENHSPLARLFSGYRAGYAGLKDLVPGNANGDGINTGVIKEWVDYFYQGQPEYQSDDKWYELVLQAESAKRRGSSGSDKAAGELPISKPVPGNNKSRTGNSQDAEQKQPAENFEPDISLSRTYELVFEKNPIPVNVKTRRYTGQSMKDPFIVKAMGYNFEFDYNPRHEYFEDSLVSPLDCLLIDLSHHFLVLSAQPVSSYPVSLIERMLREKYFPETQTNVSRIAEMALALLNELRVHLDGRLPDASPIDASMLDSEDLRTIQIRALQDDMGDQEYANEVVRAGKFVKYIGNKSLIRLIGLFPDLVMDNNFFSYPYAKQPSNLQSEALQMLLTGMEDVWWLSEDGRNVVSKDNAWRLRYRRALASLHLVKSWRS